MRIYLQLPGDIDHRVTRYYQLILQQDLLSGWTLIREWGQQGASGRVKSENFATRDEAEVALMAARDAQIDKGYRIVFAQGEKI
jgi:predicted DNA-binding WGR domain protein